MSEIIQVELSIAAAPSQVFQAVTRADELTHWFAEHAEVSQAEGRYDFWGQTTPEGLPPDQGRHRLLSWEEDRSLAFAWPVRGEESTVTMTLAPQEQGTLLRLVHEGLPARKPGQASFTDFWELSLENLRGCV